jgi:hypothetical protein
MDDLDDGPVNAGVEADEQQAAHQCKHSAGQARPIRPAPSPLSVARRGEHRRTPAAQQARAGLSLQPRRWGGGLGDA